MAKRLNILSAGASVPFADGGLKLSKSIKISEIETHPDFQSLFRIDEELLERIIASINENGFDASQPVHIWTLTDDDGTVHHYLIDGYTRIAALEKAGHETVPYYEHKFEGFDEAYKYVLGLQVNRRNLESSELLRNVSKLMGTDFIQNTEGKKSEAIAEILGVSDRTVEKAISVSENAVEETLAKIESGELSVNKAYKQNKEKSKEEPRKQESSDEDPDDISDALEYTDGNPRSVTVRSREMSEYYNPPEESEIDKRLIGRYQEGFIEGFEQAANYVLMLATHGVSNTYIYEQIFCTKTKHNFKGLSMMRGDDPVSDYDYNEFRKKLLSNPRITDLNPLPLKEDSRNTEEEYDGPGLPFEEPEQSDEAESEPEKSGLTDLNEIGDSDSAFDVF